MRCPKCGKENPGNSQFCIYCGMKFNAGAFAGGQQAGEAQQGAGYRQQMGGMNQQRDNRPAGGVRGALFGDMRNLIMEQDEKVQGSLQNNMMANIFLSWSVRERDFFFTNKRLYFKEKRYHKMGLSTTDIVVDLEDISLISVENHNPFWFLVFSGIMFLVGIIVAASSSSSLGVSAMFGFFVVALVYLAIYFKARGATLKIYFHGGSERISVGMYSYADVLVFEKGLKQTCIQCRREKGR